MITLTNLSMLKAIDFFSLPVAQQNALPYDDEDQLAAELSETRLEQVQDQPLPEIEAVDFEILYGWFLS